MNVKVIVGSAAVVLALSMASGPVAANGDDQDRFHPFGKLVGAWQVRLTPYFCDTGVPLPPEFSFDSLMTFHAGGTLTETTSNPRFQPGQRSPGLGYWTRTERRSFEVVFEAFVQFTAVNYTQGRQRVVQDLELVDVDHWNSIGVVQFTDVTGAPLAAGCVRAVGVRMP